MKHYTDKNTNEVFGYDSFEVAKEYNNDYENLVEMTDEQFTEFRDNRPNGGQWTWDKGWVIVDELLKEEQEAELEFKRQELNQQVQDLTVKIQEHILMDELDEARELVLEKRQLEEELNVKQHKAETP